MESSSLSIDFAPGQVYTGYDQLYNYSYTFVVTEIANLYIHALYLTYSSDHLPSRYPMTSFHKYSIFADHAKLVTLTPYTSITDLKKYHPELFI